MAKGRMLNRNVSLSMKFGALVNDTTRLLATWTIPHLDKRGVFHGDPQIVRSLIFPLRQDLNTHEVAAMLDDIERVGLIRRFCAAGRMWQVWPGFADNQKGLHAEREGTDFPPPPDDFGRSPETSGKTPATAGLTPATAGQSGPEVQVQVQREREVQQESADAPAATTEPGPIPFSDPDPFTAAARRAGIGSQPSPRSAAAKKSAAAQFDIGVLEDAPAIKTHRDVCGYVPMTPEQARMICGAVNGVADAAWRDNLTYWMAQGYRPDNFDGQVQRLATESKRTQARAKQPAAPKPGQWQPARGMYPQVPDRTPEQMAEIHRQDLERTKARVAAVVDVIDHGKTTEVPF